MHILLINPNSDSYSNPTLAYIISELNTQKDVEITLVAPKQVGVVPENSNGLVHKEFNIFQVTWSKKFWKWFGIIWNYIRLIRYCYQNNIKKIITVDPAGLIIGGRLKKLLWFPELHYISFEIFFQDELLKYPYYLKIKQKESHYSNSVDVLVIQDQTREMLLLSENKFVENRLKIFHIPVAPRLYKTDADARMKFRKKLGIREEETILLHSGSVASWSGGQFLVDLLKEGLPPHFRILIHSKYKLSASNHLHAELMRLQSEGYPVLLHDDTFPDYGDYLNFLRCADYGLAFYKVDLSSPYTGKNLQEMGLASGKFSCYMSQGIPTIVSASSMYSELSRKYNYGLIVEDAHELNQILRNTHQLSFGKDSIRALYLNELDPERLGRPYIQYLTTQSQDNINGSLLAE